MTENSSTSDECLCGLSFIFIPLHVPDNGHGNSGAFLPKPCPSPTLSREAPQSLPSQLGSSSVPKLSGGIRQKERDKGKTKEWDKGHMYVQGQKKGYILGWARPALSLHFSPLLLFRRRSRHHAPDLCISRPFLSSSRPHSPLVLREPSSVSTRIPFLSPSTFFVSEGQALHLATR